MKPKIPRKMDILKTLPVTQAEEIVIATMGLIIVLIASTLITTYLTISNILKRFRGTL